MVSGWGIVTLEKEDVLRHLKSREMLTSCVKNEVVIWGREEEPTLEKAILLLGETGRATLSVS